MTPGELTKVPGSAIVLGILMAVSWLIVSWIWWINRPRDAPTWEKLLIAIVALFGAERFLTFGIGFGMVIHAHQALMRVDLEVRVPESSGFTESVIEITIKPDDSLWLEDGSETDLKSFQGILGDLEPGPIRIRAAEKASHFRIKEVIQAAAEMGFNEIIFSAYQAEK